MSRRSRWSGAAGLALAAGMIASACGIPIEASPRVLPKTALPEVLRLPPPTPSGGPPPAKAPFTIFIYLIQGISGDLVRVSRPVADRPTVQAVLNQLEAGPLSTDYHDGYESAVSTSSHLQSIGKVVNHVAKIRLDSYFSALTGEEPVQELGQIVWSVTHTPLGVDKVRFVGPDGLPVAVETASGTFVNPGKPVGPNNYILQNP